MRAQGMNLFCSSFREENLAKDMGLFHVSDCVPSIVAPLITGALTFGLKQRGDLSLYSVWAWVFAMAAFWYALSCAAIFLYFNRVKEHKNVAH